MRGAPDVLVVGGGPAGLAAAIALARRGASVEVIDRRRPPYDKPCGEGLMPGARAALAELGVVPEGGLPLRAITYLDSEHRVTAPLPLPGLGLRRPRLQRALVERCAELGVAFDWQTSAQGLVRRQGRFAVSSSRGELHAGTVVAADGLRSPLRRWAGLERRLARRPERFGMRRHFAVAPWSDAVEVHWADGAEAYVTPVGPGEVGVALLWSGARLPYAALVRRFAELERRLGSAPPTTPVAGCGPLRQEARAVLRSNLVLVGDASGYLDAITGEGLDLALRQALALAEAVSAGELRGYARAHRRQRRLPDRLTRLVLLLSARPALRRRVLALFAAEPDLFRRLLAVVTGESGLSSVGPLGALKLLRCL